MVRLRNGTSYAGIVEMCWLAQNDEQYRWLPVCSEGWTSTEAEAVCQELNINTTKLGTKINHYDDTTKCDRTCIYTIQVSKQLHLVSNNHAMEME